MRKMRHIRSGVEFNVVEHIITENLYEYYVTEDKVSKDVKWCLAVKPMNEMETLYIPTIKKYILNRTKNLKIVYPAPDHEWVN